MKNLKNPDKILSPTHPAFTEPITIQQCYDDAISIGINPQVLAKVILGKARPSPLLIKRLRSLYSEDIIQKIIQDYDPYRYYDFYNNLDKSDYYVDDHYQASRLFPGCCLLTTDKRWVKISQVETTQTRTRLYSGGCVVCTIGNNIQVIAAIPKNNEEKFSQKNLSSQGETVRKITGIEKTPEEEKNRQDIIESMIKDIENNKEI